MKPNFALTLTHDSISLLHRTARGWLEIGGATLDAPDLDEALSYLRRSALGLSPTGITTKLVIPNSEILYDDVDAPGPDAASRRAQIKEALQGRTPYSVEDLVFDWQGTGPVVKVAVVARSTLTEAEDFAAQARFNPVSFVATPTPGSFGGEPWFGTSSLAASLLPKGTVVERDQDPISIVAREMPRTDPVAAAEPAASVAPAAPAQATAPEPAQGTTEPAQPPKVQPPASNAEAPKPGATATSTMSTSDKTEAAQDMPDPARASLAAKAAVVTAEKIDPQPEQGNLPPRVGESTHPAPPHPVAPASANFATRRNPDGKATSSPSASGTDRPSRLTLPPNPVNLPDNNGPAPTLVQSAPPIARPNTPPVPGQARKAPPAPVTPHKPDRTQAGLVTASGIPGLTPVRPRPAKPTMPPAAAPTTAPASAKTGLDGLAVPPVRRHGKPRFLGLILTGALLVILAMIAAWSAYYISSNEPSESGTTSGAVAALSDSPDQAAEIPAIEDEMLADQQDPEDFPADLTEQDVTGQEDQSPAAMPADTDMAAPAPTPEAQPAPQSAPMPDPSPVPTTITESDAVFGPTTTPQDEIFLATMDTPPPGLDALALPHPDATPDSPPAVQPTPPPFGTEYQFDENGMIQPTAAGIVTPDGVRLVAGRPAKTPPARPLIATYPPLSENAAEQIFPSDPAMAGFRPRSRPAGLAPVQPAALNAPTNDAAQPAPSRFAGLRPRPRPSAAFALAESARRATVSASTAALGPQITDQISPLAVAVSRRPAARPATFAKSVEAAVAAAIRQPATQSTAEAETEAEPESTASAAPRIPTRASVAKNATFVSAINLSKTNLIGIYGTSSSRYALIRQSNGRYKKVKVGDKVEGGVVAAITANELRYQKSGKIYALTLPES